MHYTIPVSQRQRKLIKSLHRKQKRDENDLFVAEGIKLCQELIDSEFEAIQIVAKESPPQEVVKLLDRFNTKGVPVYTCPKHKFTQLCKQKTPEGIMAVVGRKELEIDTKKSFVALDGVSDPGNVGTIIRTADWFGIKQVILGAESADQFGPQAVRASMGSIFRTTVVYREDLSEFIKENFDGVDLYSADSNSKNPLEKVKPAKQIGLIFGSESHGLSEDLQKLVKNDFQITGNGSSDSLNVAVSAGIALNYFTKQ